MSTTPPCTNRAVANDTSILRIIVVWCCVNSTFVFAVDDVDFNRDIRPILSNRCFHCHGPDEESREADLRLDLRDEAIASAITSGHADDSELIARVTETDPDLRMPPPDVGDALTPKEVELLRRWIDAGAEYAKHWSFEPIKTPKVPAIKVNSPLRNPIDHFIVERLAQDGIEPSPEADRYTLIRRVYLDLLGLPPSIDEVDQFIADQRDDAYERMVERVLENPHFGERWGRHWLDQARYADSNGYAIDAARTMWPYRDWVIDAFNRDLPFDQFTIEQLAGDLLDQPTLQQKIATGFHRNTLVNTEGGTKADQFRDEQVKDRVDTTGLVWMGLTVGCAKCHTHKFDPITQHEYYQLYAFFNHTTDANSVSPQVKVASEEQNDRLAELRDLEASLKQKKAKDSSRAARQTAWEKQLAETARQDGSETADRYNWQVMKLSAESTKGSKLQSQPDNSVLVVKDNGDSSDDYHCTSDETPRTIHSVRLETLTDKSLPKNGPGRAGNGNFVLSEFWLETGDGTKHTFSTAVAEHSQPKYDVADAIDDNRGTGWAINSPPEGSMNRNRTAWFVLSKPLSLKATDTLKFRLLFNQNKYGIGRFRISVSAKKWVDKEQDAELANLAALDRAGRSKDQQKKLDDAFVKQDSLLGDLEKQLKDAKSKLDKLQKSVPSAMVLQERSDPRKTYLQVRGDFLRTSDEVGENVPAVLPPMATKESRQTRLDLAEWLISPEHPLTARVRVNRIWMRLFGRGLVETENDFGIQGTLPTHPELLDWLASEFQRLDWSQKKLIHLIMTSATYRQSSAARPDLDSIDKRNLLLARQNRLRVEAEIVRDLALSVSGKLTPTIGGPSVYPPQEAGVYAFTQNKKNWRTSSGEDRFRRGMYIFFYRSAQYPMLETFDVPKFNATCTQRSRSNTPLQSLSVANSEAMFELATAFGERIMAQKYSSDNERLAFAFRTCFGRSPKSPEVDVLTRYLTQSRERFNDEGKSWNAVARLLINLDEFITRE